MKAKEDLARETHVSRLLAAEDLRRGDFASILHEVVEYPSFWLGCDAQLYPPNELVRMQCRSSESGVPLKVKAICLPFVFVKKPCGEHRTLDVRQHRLARLSADYARPVWAGTERRGWQCEVGMRIKYGLTYVGRRLAARAIFWPIRAILWSLRRFSLSQ
jgi:hypothetical protein